MTTSLNLPQADFSSLKQSLRSFLANQGQFADFNFEGANISAFVDVLAYNTYIKNFYHNMAVAETFSDSARLRTNVIARAQENGYVPRSFTSATALINFTITSTDLQRSSVVIPKGTSVTTRVDNRSFTFVTLEPVLTTLIQQTNNSLVFSATNVRVAEGFVVGDSYVFNSDSDLFDITNEQIDTTSINVTVIEDQTNAIEYSLANTVVGITSTSPVYFLRVGPNGRYAIHFGNSTIGRKPKTGSLVVIEYRVSNGQLPNGAFVFKPGSDIDGESNITVTTTSAAVGGDIYESIESIRFNSRQSNITQGRSVYEEDFKQDIAQTFPYIVDINVVGGESVTPPAFGRIVITAVVDDQMNPSTQQIEEITQYVLTRSPLTTRPVFKPANIIRLGINTKVRRTNAKSYEYIRSVVAAAIDQYNQMNISKFGRPAIKSRLTAAIDNVDSSIIGNSTDITLLYKASTNVPTTIEFANQIDLLSSTPFTYNGNSCRLNGDDNGRIYIVNNTTEENATLSPIGSVDYSTGLVMFTVTDNIPQRFDVVAQPVDDDINCSTNMIVKIDQSDITIV